MCKDNDIFIHKLREPYVCMCADRDFADGHFILKDKKLSR